MDFDSLDEVSTVEQLENLFGTPHTQSMIKEIDYISEDYARFIEKAPFLVMASSGPGGLDTSPRGDPAGFVRIHDAKTLLIPDRRGNNRIDTLRNLVTDPRISLIFLIPGVGETLRVNGTAKIIVDEELCQSFAMQNKKANCVIAVKTEQVYFQCQKALVRSKLWDPSCHIERSELPSTGTIIQNLDKNFDGDTYDKNYPERLKSTIY